MGILTEYLVDHIDEACIGIDKEGRIHFINRAACTLFGVKEDAVTGARIWDALQMSDFTRSFVRLVKDSDPEYREQLVIMPDQRALHAQMYPARGSEGRLAGAVAVIRDVTSIKRIEQDVTLLVRRISEELKVPLTSIKGCVETLLEGAYTEPTVLRRFLQMINDETNRMARLLLGLLDIGDVRPPPADAPTGPVALTTLIRGVCDSLAPLIQQKKLALEIDIPDNLPIVRANEALLRQAIVNLTDNAIKFCQGTQLQDGTFEPGRVRLGASYNGLCVLLEVQDSGVGIPADEVDKIFERFYRVSTGPAAQLGGTGLGLSIAKEIVEGCGGKIEVHSVFGRGSTFVVTLPRDLPE